jgi:hypothetical protein
VITGGIVSPWGLDKAVLSLCAARICRLVLAEVVREEVEENLLLSAGRLCAEEAEELIENYRRLIELIRPESIPYPGADIVQANRHLIRHESDVPAFHAGCGATYRLAYRYANGVFSNAFVAARVRSRWRRSS